MAMTFSRKWIRLVFVGLLAAAVVIGAVSVLTWLGHTRSVSATPGAAIAATVEIPTLAWRIEQLEVGLERVRTEHNRIMWLLVGNLGAVSASLFTYLATNRRRFLNGPEGRFQ